MSWRKNLSGGLLVASAVMSGLAVAAMAGFFADPGATGIDVFVVAPNMAAVVWASGLAVSVATLFVWRAYWKYAIAVVVLGSLPLASWPALVYTRKSEWAKVKERLEREREEKEALEAFRKGLRETGGVPAQTAPTNEMWQPVEMSLTNR